MAGERYVGNLPKIAVAKYYSLVQGFAIQGIAVACQLRLWARVDEGGTKVQASVRVPSVEDLTERLTNAPM